MYHMTETRHMYIIFANANPVLKFKTSQSLTAASEEIQTVFQRKLEGMHRELHILN